MRFPRLSLVLSFCLFLVSGEACAERWVEFHTESWSHYSRKLKKKLYFSTISHFDADSLSRSENGDVSVEIRDISRNDRFYVGKGIPEKEVVYKRILLRCVTRKYEVVVEDGAGTETHESVGDEIKAGSVYDKLHRKVCDGGR